jgi:Zn-dependent protease
MHILPFLCARPRLRLIIKFIKFWAAAFLSFPIFLLALGRSYFYAQWARSEYVIILVSMILIRWTN